MDADAVERWTEFFRGRERPPRAFASAVRDGWSPEDRDALAEEAVGYRERMRAYLESLRDAEVDLVRLDLRDDGCDVCEPYDGCVYSLLGQTDGLAAPPPLPICPACRHTINMLTPYFLQNAEATLDEMVAESRPFEAPEIPTRRADED